MSLYENYCQNKQKPKTINTPPGKSFIMRPFLTSRNYRNSSLFEVPVPDKIFNRGLISSYDVKKNATQLYEEMKKLDPQVRIPKPLECYKPTHSFAREQTILNNTATDKCISQSCLEKFERSFLKQYHIDCLFSGGEDLLKKALDLCKIKSEMDLDIMNMDVETRKQLQCRSMIPNRQEIVTLAKWIRDKIHYIELNIKESAEKYQKCSYLSLIHI